MTTLDIQLKRVDKIYHEEEALTGIIILTSNCEFKHDGIVLIVEGSVNIQLSTKNVGLLDAFYNSAKPCPLINVTCEVCSAGRFPTGTTEIPFEIPLKSKPNRSLYETYHGVYINVSYAIRCDIKRSFLSKDLQRSLQFLIQQRPTLFVQPHEGLRPIQFNLSPAKLATGGMNAPDFALRGRLDSTRCFVSEPFTGHVVLERCAMSVRSLELQLVRVETCGCAEGYAREATEIQNIQIGDGDIPHNTEIPIFMVFPRLFTCPTLINKNFKIEFEVNLVIIFHDDHLVTNNFPITLIR